VRRGVSPACFTKAAPSKNTHHQLINYKQNCQCLNSFIKTKVFSNLLTTRSFCGASKKQPGIPSEIKYELGVNNAINCTDEGSFCAEDVLTMISLPSHGAEDVLTMICLPGHGTEDVLTMISLPSHGAGDVLTMICLPSHGAEDVLTMICLPSHGAEDVLTMNCLPCRFSSLKIFTKGISIGVFPVPISGACPLFGCLIII